MKRAPMRRWTVADAEKMRVRVAAGGSYNAVAHEFSTHGQQVKAMCDPRWWPRAVALEDRLWDRVNRRGSDECWLWKGCTNPEGYGMIGVGKKAVGTHRVAYMLTHGEIPDGLFVLHSCDARWCCNPAHLSLGDQAENMRQAGERGRMRSGSRHPHVRYSEAKIAHVKRLIVRGHLMQTEIAERTGVSPSYVCQIAHGKARRCG